MAQFTKKAIIEAFYKLLSEKPLDKITVKEIIEECSVTRNTFYYYYSDVYELFEDELKATVEKITDDKSVFEPGEYTLKLISEAVRNKKIIKNIYASRDKFGLDRRISEAVEYIVHNIVEDYAVNTSRSSEDIRLICKMMTYTVVGAVNEWMSGRMKDLSEDELRRMLALFRENIIVFLHSEGDNN